MLLPNRGWEGENQKRKKASKQDSETMRQVQKNRENAKTETETEKNTQNIIKLAVQNNHKNQKLRRNSDSRNNAEINLAQQVF